MSISDAELTRLVESTELTLPALVEVIVAHASAAPVIDIGRSTWRERQELLEGDSLAL